MELAEFLMKMIQIGTITFAMISIILSSAVFTARLNEYSTLKSAIDIAEAVTAAPCLAEVINGEVRKGLLVADKLDEISSNNLCIDINLDYYIRISDIEGNEWEIGNDFEAGESSDISVAIKHGNKVVAGGVYVKVKKQE